MKPAIICAIWCMLLHFAGARATSIPSVPVLFEQASLAVTGEVASVDPLGVETTLSYPTVDSIKFHWLRVTVNVGTVLKGQLASKSVDVAMLAVGPNNFFANGPLLLGPRPGQKYVMFLDPTEREGVFASILAPYDEANAIFILDRSAAEEELSHAVHPDYKKQIQEKKEMIWSLVDKEGNLSESGAREIAAKYKTQITSKPAARKLALEWTKHTGTGGWSIDVPKSKAKPSESRK